MCSANNEPTEFLSVDNLTKHVKDLTMTNALKKSESYFQTKYNRVPINTQTIKGKSQDILNPKVKVHLQYSFQNCYGGQLADHIHE